MNSNAIELDSRVKHFAKKLNNRIINTPVTVIATLPGRGVQYAMTQSDSRIVRHLATCRTEIEVLDNIEAARTLAQTAKHPVIEIELDPIVPRRFANRVLTFQIDIVQRLLHERSQTASESSAKEHFVIIVHADDWERTAALIPDPFAGFREFPVISITNEMSN